MVLNKRRPYGVIVGHEWARYEQDGVLFDGNGNAQESSALIERVSRRSKKEPEQDLKVANAREFLKNLLAGGPVDKSSVYRECENNNQDWESVKKAFALMNGQVVERGSSKLWRLTELANRN